MAEIAQALKLLADFGVHCVVIGGVAAGARGATQATFDVDVCYARDEGNLVRVAQALRSANATLRGAPKDIPFILDEETLQRGMNFTFDTDIGSIDLLGEVRGVGGYAECLQNSNEMELFGYPFRVLALRELIASKRAAGRRKDLVVLPELEAILEYETTRENSSSGIDSKT
jgi:predicted nucleotidyltransferase